MTKQKIEESTERELPSGAIIDDQRSDEEKKRTIGFVVAIDNFMSGWGMAQGISYFAVPFETWDEAVTVEVNMRRRDEMKCVRIVGPDYQPKLREGDHLSIRAHRRGDTDRFFVMGGF